MFGLTRSIGGWEEGERGERNKLKSQPGRSYQLTSDLRDVSFLGYACNARVSSSFGGYVRLSPLRAIHT